MEEALQRWRSEKTAAYLSGAVAASEPDSKRAALFRQMAAAAEEQAGILAKDLPGAALRALAQVAADRLSLTPVRSARHAPGAVRLKGQRRLGL